MNGSPKVESEHPLRGLKIALRGERSRVFSFRHARMNGVRSMTLSKVVKVTVLSAAVLGAAVTLPWAFCDSASETYAIFQCADRGYFAPVPAPYTPHDVSGIFWQIGFGSRLINSGNQTNGTGVEQGTTVFNGNDNGLFAVAIADAAAEFGPAGFPFPVGSVCLTSNDWGNAGVDGCNDNQRVQNDFAYDNQYDGIPADPNLPIFYPANDDILNPFFGLGGQGLGQYSIGSMQDYPTAVLLTTSDGAYFALAAVTNMNRGNTGTADNGPCAGTDPGTNTAACDIRQGFFTLEDVRNGTTNVMTGANSVIPWQAAPKPHVACIAGCSGPTDTRQLSVQIDPIRWYHDMRSIPSNHPAMATRNLALTRNATRAGGVGVSDLLAKWGGLVRYSLDSAILVTDGTGTGVDYAALAFTPVPGFQNMPGMVSPSGEPSGPLSFNINSAPDTCYRVRVNFGKVPEVTNTTAANCRIGRCGDAGIGVASQVEGSVTCIGGALASEAIVSSGIDTGRGAFTLRWETNSELTVQGFEVFAISKRGELKVGEVGCAECTTGLPGSYKLTLSRGDLRGGPVEAFKIKMLGGNGDEVTVDVRDSRGRGRGRH
jgi:hypothetical protein